MTLLAAAGIYLVLDVNSPLLDHHLNRYEPWNTYNPQYLENVFKVVEQFSHYNNTLGFFAGNEVINDAESAMHSPRYVKAVVRDIKNYIKKHSPRTIPVGYSAADDLKYRISLYEYLECVSESPEDSIDFYGVNTYQWCGKQTFQSSGYDVLTKDYSNYNRPIFFSEYGCNEVCPRRFEEIGAIYSTDMIGVISGGLVYEFTQEPNNYGLVQVLPNGDVELLEDFFAFKQQSVQAAEIDYPYVFEVMKVDIQNFKAKSKVQNYDVPYCEETYPNLDISQGLPPSLASDLIKTGVSTRQGKYVDLEERYLTTTHKIFDPDHAIHRGETQIRLVVENRDVGSHWSDLYSNSTYTSILV